MSYCRCMTPNSDVYIYMDLDGFLSVSFCVGRPEIAQKVAKNQLKKEYLFKNRREALEFLTLLQDWEFHVPVKVFERLEMETW